MKQIFAAIILSFILFPNLAQADFLQCWKDIHNIQRCIYITTDNKSDHSKSSNHHETKDNGGDTGGNNNGDTGKNHECRSN